MLRSVIGAAANSMMLFQCNSDVPISLACFASRATVRTCCIIGHKEAILEDMTETPEKPPSGPQQDADPRERDESGVPGDADIALRAHLAGSGVLDRLVEIARAYAWAAVSENTLKAYAKEWAHFARWCWMRGLRQPRRDRRGLRAEAAGPCELRNGSPLPTPRRQVPRRPREGGRAVTGQPSFR